MTNRIQDNNNESITKFITFCSYNGGVGKTLTLSNLASIATEHGKDVVVVDFDLNAPGISNIPLFRDCIDDHFKGSKGGLFDYISNFKPADQQTHSLLDYITKPIQHEKGHIYIMPAGKEDINYFNDVHSFNWKDFYENDKGKNFFNVFKKKIQEYQNIDIVLIDTTSGFPNAGMMNLLSYTDRLLLFTNLTDGGLQGCKKVLDFIDDSKSKTYLGPKNIIIVGSPRDMNAEQDVLVKQIDKSHSILKRDLDVILPRDVILRLESRILPEKPSYMKAIISDIREKYKEIYSLIGITN